MAKRTTKCGVSASSGNAFADLGFANAEEKQKKVRLALAINQLLASRRLTQTAGARALGVNQSKISALRNYQLDSFSVDQLMNFLTTLDR
jgi:predicted XRE-type DNA-binding protein